MAEVHASAARARAQDTMSHEQLFFEPLKVDRGRYFVEYSPPNVAVAFATLSLVFPEAADPRDVASAMERELAEWLRRYDVPTMVSAFDAKEAVIPLESVRACDHVIGWNDGETGKPLLHWRLVSNAELPRLSWTPSELRAIYTDIPFRTSGQRQEAARRHRRLVRVGMAFAFTWAVVIPVVIGTVDFLAPAWLEWLAWMYCWARAYIEVMKLLRRWPKTDKELADAEEERLMRHHHYHCKRNPEAFERLKMENFERETRQAVQREAASLKDRRHRKLEDTARS